MTTDGEGRGVTVAELLRERVGDDAAGLRFEDTSWTWDEVVRESAVRSAILAPWQAAGPAHIGVLLDNVPEYAFWLGGAALSGAVIVGVNPTRRGPELSADIACAECRVIVTDEAGLALLKDADLPGVELVLDIGAPEYAELLAAHAGAAVPDAPVDPAALLLLLFTSGTSGGAPKAVRCTQGRLAGAGRRVSGQYDISRDDVCYCPMPMFHGNALMALWAPALYAGACVVLPRKFSASRFLPDVRRYGATYFTYVGKAVTYVLARPEGPDDADNRLVRAFGNEASAADVREFRRRFGCELIEGFGSSEGGVTIARVPGTPDGALGLPVAGDVVVVDPDTKAECPRARFAPDGRFLNADEAVGELVNRDGAPGFEGYWKNPAAESERLRDGWYWSGDLAYRDEDGWFWYAGRANDWLRVDGENFAAVPIERVLVRHDDIVLAAVYAVPDTRAGDQVMAAVELRDGAVLDPAGLAEFFAAQTDMGTKWLPRFVRVVDTMPFTGSNKVLKRDLRAQAWGCDDRVLWRPDPRAGTFRELTAADREQLTAALAEHGRAHLLGTAG